MNPAIASALQRIPLARTEEFRRAAINRLLQELRHELAAPMRTNMKIIGLTAIPAAGRTTAANLLRDWGFVPVSIAHPLMNEVAIAYGITDWRQFTDRALFDQRQSRFAIYRSRDEGFRTAMACAGIDTSTSRSLAELLQLWGTTYRRAAESNYWIARVDRRMRELVHGGQLRIVLTDIERPNEAELVRAWGGEIWRVQRVETLAQPVNAGSLHQPEAMRADRDVLNDGSRHHLAAELARHLKDAGISITRRIS